MIITEGRLTVRWYGAADLPRLVDLFRACFPSQKWVEESFIAFLGKRHDGSNDRFPKGSTNVVKVLTGSDDEVYGALLYTFWDGEDAACVIRRLAIWPDYRRRGLGRHIVNHLVGRRSPMRVPLITARVHERYWEAQALLKNAGFVFRGNEPRQLCKDGSEYYTFRMRRQ